MRTPVDLLRRWYIIANGIEVEAVVSHHRKTAASFRLSRDTHHALLVYTIDRKKYHTTLSSKNAALLPEVGTCIRTYYLKSNPKRAMVTGVPYSLTHNKYAIAAGTGLWFILLAVLLAVLYVVFFGR